MPALDVQPSNAGAACNRLIAKSYCQMAAGFQENRAGA
jgi:hypothetical protein